MFIGPDAKSSNATLEPSSTLLPLFPFISPVRSGSVWLCPGRPLTSIGEPAATRPWVHLERPKYGLVQTQIPPVVTRKGVRGGVTKRHRSKHYWKTSRATCAHIPAIIACVVEPIRRSLPRNTHVELFLLRRCMSLFELGNDSFSSRPIG